MQKSVITPALEIGYEEHGDQHGDVVILLHGFPDDPRAWDGVWPGLVDGGHRVLVPWLRGYGPTKFRDPATPRSGQQAALGNDLREFMDALQISHAILAGYDWGGRAACITAALWPERARGLVTVGGYNIQNIATSGTPAAASTEHRLWYQWYLHTERGQAGLEANRRDFARLLWQLWSPNYGFDDETFEATARSFDNPDFVDVVVQSYRHRYGYVEGDPGLEEIELALAAQPPIKVPTISLVGTADGVAPLSAQDRAATFFTGSYQRRVVEGAGHFLPREAPRDVVAAVEELAAK